MSTDPSRARLNRSTSIDARGMEEPEHRRYAFPERILQFGTGAFLRGFTNVYFDRAIRACRFRGRIVVVGSTRSGRSAQFNAQEGLYTVCVQGMHDGEVVDRCSVVGSVSRAIDATAHWQNVLEVARSPQIEFVVSNTTEVGIRLDPDDRRDLDPPNTFPGKLTALLQERAEALAYHPERGLTILCCELIEDNAQTLRSIVLELIERWSLGTALTDWVGTHNRFCNTLVDRIVPGRPDASKMRELEARLGYADELLVQAEPYSFWAIEGSDALRERLPFAGGEAGVVVTPDISAYRTRKVRLLNGAHTAMVPVALLCGLDTVQEAMNDRMISAYVHRILFQEIVPTLEAPGAEDFAREVIDRFANPFVRHELLSIALQQSMKMNVRVVPSIEAYARRTGRLPEGLTLGFTAFLHLVTGGGRAGGAGPTDLSADDLADVVRSHWRSSGPARLDAFVRAVCADRTLWHVPLDDLPGFVLAVSSELRDFRETGIRASLQSLLH